MLGAGNMGSLGRSRIGPAWSPLMLFGLSETGGWWDPSDLATMWQESTQTTAAAVDSPVGHINDKSGNGNHLQQATAGARPTLRQTAAGRYYLEFDGSADFLQALFTIAQPWDRISGLLQDTWTSNDRVFGGGNANGGLLIQKTTAPELNMNSGAVLASDPDPAVDTAFVTVERHNGASSRFGINANAYVTGDAGANTPGGFTVGAHHSDVLHSNVWWFGSVMIGRAMTDFEIGYARAHYASIAGAAL